MILISKFNKEKNRSITERLYRDKKLGGFYIAPLFKIHIKVNITLLKSFNFYSFN